MRRIVSMGLMSVAIWLPQFASFGQAPYDAEARTELAEEINRTYGNLVSSSLSTAELFDIKNRLDKADEIAQKYGVDLDYRQHSFSDLCDIESRVTVADRINRQYGQNLDWTQYDFQQLLEAEKILRDEVQTADSLTRDHPPQR